MSVTGLDHLVLTVADIEATCEFYVKALGMQRDLFAGERTALKFGTQKINLHEAGNEFEPRAVHPTPGSGDLCFIVENLEAAKLRLDAEGVEIIEGPVTRTGASGKLMSIYCRDPDGNLIELSQYE
ncbi:MAG: VOC family protein [Hyphomicrobiaceae bacterium]|nr:VOC family protein [Hyphomicrobiaceae bacterium]